jgi:hypothetical protein
MLEGEAHPSEDLFFDLHRLLAPHAEPTSESLGDHAVHRRGSKEGLHAHIREAIKGAGRVVGMERSEDDVLKRLILLPSNSGSTEARERCASSG